MFGFIFFIIQFPSLNFHHSSLITLKYQGYLALSLTCHHSIFFTLFVSLISVMGAIFFFLVPRNTNPVKKKRKKPRRRRPNPLKEERKKKEKKRKNLRRRRADQKKGKKKKKKSRLVKKVRLSYD